MMSQAWTCKLCGMVMFPSKNGMPTGHGNCPGSEGKPKEVLPWGVFQSVKANGY